MRTHVSLSDAPVTTESNFSPILDASSMAAADFKIKALDGDTVLARDLLRQASTACGYDYTEKDGARYELARLP